MALTVKEPESPLSTRRVYLPAASALTWIRTAPVPDPEVIATPDASSNETRMLLPFDVVISATSGPAVTESGKSRTVCFLLREPLNELVVSVAVGDGDGAGDDVGEGSGSGGGIGSELPGTSAERNTESATFQCLARYEFCGGRGLK